MPKNTYTKTCTNDHTYYNNHNMHINAIINIKSKWGIKWCLAFKTNINMNTTYDISFGQKYNNDTQFDAF